MEEQARNERGDGERQHIGLRQLHTLFAQQLSAADQSGTKDNQNQKIHGERFFYYGRSFL
ncbi:MAG TPA: hypothetical protein VK206_17190 [Anaerolineales bacterium]|nr:hypothetical protein [Anaerolineales bacterium]